ncbi:BED-type domain-containing protein [Abeliophyllum distichum]|uniref:BED-type domain-containing protein n=1 Tax=Abeliophyllum distichum TaxID=126358 RepID=A0ABD1V6M5_9LAMI
MDIGENRDDDVEDISVALQRNEKSKGKRKAVEGIDNYFAPRTTPGSQPSIKSVLADATSAIGPGFKGPSYDDLRINLLRDLKIVAPLIRLLRIVDADEKPSLGYVYDGMDRAEKTIKNIFLIKERLYKPYIDIIDERWDKHLRHNIHVAAYFLNPAFIYEEGFLSSHEWSPQFA